MQLKIFVAATLCAFMDLQWAQAVPMFGETAGTIQQGAITLYRDHANTNKVYFFPNSTKFAKDSQGIPLFNFVYWSVEDEAKGGAYFAMTTRLASDEDQKAGLVLFMQQNPNVEVAVLPVKSSSVGLQTTAVGGTPLTNLFKEFNFANVAGRPEDEIGVNAVMTTTGAKAFKAMLTKTPGGGLLNMQYCYLTQGYGPNMDASISVDMRRVYDYFEFNSSGGYWWFSYSIQKVVETLKAEKAIQITMNGGDAKEWEYLQKIAENITTRLFTPELAANPNIPSAPNQFPFRFSGGSVHKEELQIETWTWKRTELEERHFCTNIVLKDLEKFRDKLIVSADGK